MALPKEVAEKLAKAYNLLSAAMMDIVDESRKVDSEPHRDMLIATYAEIRCSRELIKRYIPEL